MSKLDRFLIYEGLLNSCPNISSITLDRYLSDHMPILLRESHHDYGPSPFCFFHYWFELEGFDTFVKQTWNDAQVTDSNAISMFMKKMKYLKEKIRMWVKANKENSKSHKQCLQEELSKIDLLLDKGEGSSTLISKRMEILKSIQDFVKLDTMELAQKAKIKWAIEGDENSKYYHGVLNKKRNQLAIRGILVEGRWIESPILVKDEFLSYFASRFNKPPDYRLHIDLDFPNKLSLKQQMVLEIEVTREEIKKAVWDCGVDKSPGPDGFTFGFYRRYWTFLETVSVEAWFTSSIMGQFPKGSNSSFITLIPKTQEAKMMKDFRPITLIGSLYKIIAKILANRLVVVLEDLVSDVQSAFVAKRQILDGALLFNGRLWSFCTQQIRLYGPNIIKGIHGEDGKDSGNDFVWDHSQKMGNGVTFVLGGQNGGANNTLSNLTCPGIAPRAGAKELQYIQLVKIMEGFTLFDSKDRWRWSLEGCGEFIVASVRNLLDANSLPVVSSKTRWINVQLPIKVNIHVGKLC
ncbi:hypothetical protein Tco_0146095 [Tanacetum coccineum]